MSSLLVKEPLNPPHWVSCADEVFEANAQFRAQQLEGSKSLIAQKIEDLRHYDVPAMDRVAAIIMWGRSGSFLLASYLDNHEDVIALPEGRAYSLYDFYERYRALPLRDKLIGYTTFDPDYIQFFKGDFAISPTQYYAAVEAILEVYGNHPREFLESRRAFFLFVHVAYNLALGRRPSGSQPLIIYPQHVWDKTLARDLVEDFPRAKFVHTVRDPISSCDALFHFHLDTLVANHIFLPLSSLRFLVDKDRSLPGMESRTLAIRFEDMHSDPAGTMHDLADWLGLPYQDTLLESTFNGIPYVMKRDGVAWSGRRVEQVKRLSRHISAKDRALLFAFFYEDFAAWGYPYPNIVRFLLVRCMVFLSLILLPLKMERIAARAIFKGKILPAMRRGDLARVIKSCTSLAFCRVRIIRLLTLVFVRRSIFQTAVLQVRRHPQPPGRRDVAVEELQHTA
ncbi:MAG: sulfotransferase [Bryobacteraceae bacterium]